MKILVTGAAGMLGAEVDALLKKVFVVQALTRQVCDLSDRGWVLRIAEKFRPDWIVNCAAYTDVEGAEENNKQAREGNVEIPKNLAGVCNKIGAVLAHISTDFVFKGNQTRPYLEEDLPGPESVYGKTKLEGEEKAAEAGKYFVLRTSWLYGHVQKSFPARILDKIKKKEPFSVVDDQTGSPSYAKDCARFIRDLIVCDPKDYGVYHINNSGHVSRYAFACYLRDRAGLPCDISRAHTADFPSKVKRPAFSALDNSNAKKILGYRPRSWQEACDEFLNDYLDKSET